MTSRNACHSNSTFLDSMGMFDLLLNPLLADGRAGMTDLLLNPPVGG
ncbi:MAG: hypothetical protein HN757_16130 [Calditrichaeota bacterium]|nr:hypothetical protein [Calditrichota bacterium]